MRRRRPSKRKPTTTVPAIELSEFDAAWAEFFKAPDQRDWELIDRWCQTQWGGPPFVAESEPDDDSLDEIPF
ncbi:MAG TPA: hypothetical protein VGO93_32045 [Candidatus Xenobia bacterium]|jgi:hypothetical protein